MLSVPLPAGVVTTTSTAPTPFAGVVTVISVADSTSTFVASSPPIVTLVVPVKSVPAMVTDVPPDVFPVDGEIFVTVGGAAARVTVRE